MAIDNIRFTEDIPDDAEELEFEEYWLEDVLGDDGILYTDAFYENLRKIVPLADQALEDGKSYILDTDEDENLVYMDLEEFKDEAEALLPEATDLKLVIFKTEDEAKASGRARTDESTDTFTALAEELETNHGSMDEVLNALATELKEAQANGYKFFSSDHTADTAKRYYSIEWVLGNPHMEEK
ncbi:hypothetical protein [Nesterenkonia alba]|uniref:hypothetical protein n=1 Tax=Nesterenkonia alba TaxID=515814 RepID=UPI0003B622F9|nr:hypothetical protein [Nesterenkonia alba]